MSNLPRNKRKARAVAYATALATKQKKQEQEQAVFSALATAVAESSARTWKDVHRSFIANPGTGETRLKKEIRQSAVSVHQARAQAAAGSADIPGF